jgi:hypothetical protein
MINRRGLLLGFVGLIDAPSIVRAASLMKVSPMMTVQEVNRAAKQWLDATRASIADGGQPLPIVNYRELVRHWGNDQASLWKSRGLTRLPDLSADKSLEKQRTQEIVRVDLGSMHEPYLVDDRGPFRVPANWQGGGIFKP